MARIRTSARGKNAAVTPQHQLATLLGQLRAVGWTYKGPSGLASERRSRNKRGSIAETDSAEQKCSGWDYNGGWGYSGGGWDYNGVEADNQHGENDATSFFRGSFRKFRAGPSRPNATPAYACQDVSIVPEDEDERDYERFSSGESEGEDLGDNDDEPERGDIEDYNDVLSEGDAVDMDEAFIASLMIAENSLLGAAKKQREAALRATQWTVVSSNFEADVTAYAGMNDENAQHNS
ncbi:hypothetical protein F442_16432 [Phytophthora nicotianae P10297]|uniref:Uncharacterized protein n=1 Tax=Phytophthora nicotianae P10297 TaxID=1317064 RepID=W2YJX1_PHYNI|nr:hypothetical protein F442_16432 [Phytophthora nicotianae P10297]